MRKANYSKSNFLLHFLRLRVSVVWLGTFFFVYSFCGSLRAQEGAGRFIDNYSPQLYRAAIQNWAVIQDDRGLMYFANDQGILEYDGQNWRLISVHNQSAVRSLSISEEGRIYVGASSEFGYLAPDDRGDLEYVSLSQELDPSEANFKDVWSCHATQEGVYFHTDQTLYFYDFLEKSFKTWSASQDSFFFLSFWAGEHLYILDWEQGLLKLNFGKLKLIPEGEKYRKKRVYTLLTAPKNQLLIGTREEGLFLYDLRKKKGERIQEFSPEANQYLKEKQLYSGHHLPQGEWAFCTRSGGVLVLNARGEIIEHIDRSEGLADNNVHFAYVSSDYSLWLALDNGIAKVAYYLPIRFWRESAGLKGVVRDIIYHDSTLYVATSLGVFYQDLEGFKSIPGIDTQVWDLSNFRPDSLTNTLLAASNIGLLKINKNGGQVIYSKSSLEALHLYSSPSDPRRLYVGLKGGLLSLYYGKNRQWLAPKLVEGLQSEIYSLYEESPRVLWIGSFIQGLSRARISEDFLRAEVEDFDLSSGLPSLRDNRIFSWQKSFLVGTQKGLYQWEEEKNKFSPYLPIDSLLAEDQGVYTFVENQDGKIWLADVSNQFYAVSGFHNTTARVYPRYRQILGVLPEFNEPVLYPGREHELWIGGSEGLYLYNYEKEYAAPTRFSSLIRRVTLREDSLVFGGDTDSQLEKEALQFKFRNDFSIEFYCTSIFYLRDQETQYRFRLEKEAYDSWLGWMYQGSRETWSNWNDNPQKQYTNLGEGIYTFSVQAQNVLGEYSEIAEFSFKISPPWYRTRLAYITYFLTALALLFLSSRLYNARLRYQKKNLEKTVAERTLEIRDQNKKLSNQQKEILQQADDLRKASQDIQEKNQEITSSINYARRIQESMLPRKDAIQAAFQDSFILYRPRDIVSGDFYWFTETPLEPRYTKEPSLKNTPSIFRGFNAGKKIIAAVDCTGHGVPGAFMSMLGDAFLHQIVNSEGIMQPQLILKELDDYVRQSLKQKETDNVDGMDMGICIIDPNLATLSFAGAKNPLIYIQDGVLHQIRGDKMGIGGVIFDSFEEKEFTRHVISLEKETTFYILSDGYQDQFGGKKGKKFMIKRLKALLLEHYQKPMLEQQKILEDSIDEWMQGYSQVDDILVIGVRISPADLENF